MEYFFSPKRTRKFHGNVVFNFTGQPIEDISAFAAGYHNAGRRLARSMEKARGYRDYDGYPIFFLYRHALELYLKAVVYRGAQLLDLVSEKTIFDKQKLLTTHDLTTFLPAIEAIAKDRHWSWPTDSHGGLSFESFSEIIRDVEKTDPKSYMFRYPVNPKGKASMPKHFVGNVIVFARTLDQILGLLDGMVTTLDEDWDNAASVMYSVQQVLGRLA